MINEQDFTQFSPEELRNKMDDISNKFNQREINEKERAYWESLHQQAAPDMKKAVEAIRQQGWERYEKFHPAPARCTLKEAKLLLWESLNAQIGGRRDIIMNDNLKWILGGLAAWIVNDKGGPFSPYKGFFFTGAKGTSKTTIMRALQQAVRFGNPARAFAFHDVPKLYDDLLERNEVELSVYYKSHRAFDDIGFRAPTIRKWGNEISPVELILTHRYNLYTRAGVLTHATSNYDLEALTEMFDPRIASRMAEICNEIPFTGSDFRLM